MKNIFFVILFCVLCASVFGQNNQCNLALKESPQIRGLKLGMTKEEVEKVILPSSGIKLNGFLNYITDSQLSKLKGLEILKSLDIVFMREGFESPTYRVSSLTFQYKKDVVEWNSILEFAENLSGNLNLPYDAWLFQNHKAEMQCKDFSVIIMDNYILVKSTEIEDRLKIEKERKKKVFKP